MKAVTTTQRHLVVAIAFATRPVQAYAHQEVVKIVIVPLTHRHAVFVFATHLVVVPVPLDNAVMTTLIAQAYQSQSVAVPTAASGDQVLMNVNP